MKIIDDSDNSNFDLIRSEHEKLLVYLMFVRVIF